MERASLLPNRLAAHFTCPSLLLALAVTLPSHLLPFGQIFDTAALEKGRGWRQDGHWRAERLECIVLLLQHLHILIRNMHDTMTNKKIVPENAGLVATHLRKDLEGRGGDTPNKGGLSRCSSEMCQRVEIVSNGLQSTKNSTHVTRIFWLRFRFKFTSHSTVPRGLSLHRDAYTGLL